METKQLARDLARITEKLEVLTGDRGGANKSLSAVRRSELQPLASVAMQSQQVTAAPTAADFNALQADVQTLYTALSVLSNRLGNAKLPNS